MKKHMCGRARCARARCARARCGRARGEPGTHEPATCARAEPRVDSRREDRARFQSGPGRKRWLDALVGSLAIASATACGGGTPEPETSKGGGDDAKLSAAEQCIRDAEQPREAPLDAPERIDFAHILIKHAGVKGAIEADITRTREEACLRALEAREKLLASGDWDAAVEQYSEATGAMRGVVYGVTQGDLEPDFAGAAFSLDVNELSYVVETKRGFHIIVRKQ